MSQSTLAARWASMSPEWRIVAVATAVLVPDHLSKWIVVSTLRLDERRSFLPGFLDLVHWGNTGSAWSLFHGNNNLLAAVALVAVGALWYWRHHFEAHRQAGQVALGLLFGGTLGNLIDRVLPARRHVVDFLYFHLHPRGGGEAGFPAFNVADVAICTGVGLMLLLGLIPSPEPPPTTSPTPPDSHAPR